MNRASWVCVVTAVVSRLVGAAAQELTPPPVVPVQIGIDPRIASEALSVDAEAIQVTANLANTRRTVTQEEIRLTPNTERDIYQIAAQLPNVLTDRVNIGGNHTGTDYFFVQPGTSPNGNQYLIDGINIDVPSALGSSGMYVDPSGVEEVSVLRGGLSAEYGTAGTTIQILTKRGMTEWDGGIDYSLIDGKTPDNAPPLNYNQTGANSFGASIGGPIVRNKAFFFGGGSFYRGRFDFEQAGQRVDEDINTGYQHANASWEPSIGHRMRGLFFRQSRFSSGLPTLDRYEDAVWQTDANAFQLGVRYDYTKHPKFGFSGQYGRYSHPVTSTPQGGVNTSTVLLSNGIYDRSYAFFNSSRVQNQVRFSGIYTSKPSHILNFGVNYRTTSANTNVRWANDQIIIPGSTPALDSFLYPSESWFQTGNDIFNAFAEKRVTFSQVTLRGGVNVFRETGTLGPNRFLANPRQSLVTGYTEDARDQWNDTKIQPRLGLTYSLTQDDGTRLSFNYGQYTQYGGAVLSGYQSAVETDGSLRGTIRTNAAGQATGVLSPQFNTPGFAIPDSEIDPDLSIPDTSEYLFNFEHELRSDFVIGIDYALRQTANIYAELDLVNDNGVRRTALANDYYLDRRFTGTVANGPAFSADLYSTRSPVATGQGSFLTNSDASEDYQGLTLTFNKRLSNRWMLRGNFTWQDWTYSDNVSPDPSPRFGFGRAGESVFGNSPDSAKQGVYINSRWQYDVNGSYQIAPNTSWSVTLVGHMYGHQGYPVNPSLTTTRADGRIVSLQVLPSDDFRYGNVHVFDFGLRKPVNLYAARLMLNFDCYNCLGADTVLQGENDVLQTYRVLERLSPRTLRFGARFTF